MKKGSTGQVVSTVPAGFLEHKHGGLYYLSFYFRYTILLHTVASPARTCVIYTPEASPEGNQVRVWVPGLKIQ